MSDTIQAAERSAAFTLRDLKSTDVWQLVRVLRKLNLAETVKQLDQDTLKKSRFETPKKLVDGEIVPMPLTEWNEAQRKAYKAAKKANDELVWQILDILMNNIGGCEDEVNKLLAMGIDKDINFIRNMDAGDYLNLIVQYVTREGFSDFFTQARNLLGKTGVSRNSIGSVATLIK